MPYENLFSSFSSQIEQGFNKAKKVLEVKTLSDDNGSNAVAEASVKAEIFLRKYSNLKLEKESAVKAKQATSRTVKVVTKIDHQSPLKESTKPKNKIDELKEKIDKKQKKPEQQNTKLEMLLEETRKNAIFQEEELNKQVDSIKKCQDMLKATKSTLTELQLAVAEKNKNLPNNESEKIIKNESFLRKKFGCLW